MSYPLKRRLIILLALAMLVLASLACDDPLAIAVSGGDPGHPAGRDLSGRYVCDAGERKGAAVDTGLPWCFGR